MTRTLTLLAGFMLCLLSFQTFSQDYRIIGYRKNVFNNNVWNPDDSLTFAYSNGRGGDFRDYYYAGNELKYDTLRNYNWNGTTCYLNNKVIKLFNSQNFGTETYITNGVGTNSSRYIYYRDGNNNDTVNITQNWVNSAWQNTGRTVKTFDGNNNMLSSEYLQWDNNSSTWNAMYRNFYTYDVNNNMTSDVALNYLNGTSWDSSSLYIYHYTNNLRDTIYRKQHTGNTQDKRAFVYQNGMKTITYIYSLSGNTWGNGYQYFHLYQGTNNIYAGDSAQQWDVNSGTWKDYRREKYTIDNNGDAVSIVYIMANSQTGVMEISSKDTMVYNNGHKVIWDMSLQYDSNSGTFITAPMCVEDYYYYEQYTNDVPIISSNTAKPEVFPSPAKDNITIRANFETPESFKVQIYDMQGRLVLQLGEKATKDYSRNIPLNDLASGNYILQIAGTKTKTQQQFTIIK